MLFNSWVFIFAFLPVVLGGYALTSRLGWHRCAAAWLVLGSIFYYGWSDVQGLWLITASTLFNYYLGMALARIRSRGGRGAPLLCFGILVNLGSLAYFKYANFLVHNANALLGTGFPEASALLPLAISFFTFQKIAYLVDVHQGRASEYDLLEFSLFVMFFPQLIAGPIVHHAELVPQFRERGKHLEAGLVAGGMTLFIMGLCKKLLFADSVAGYANAVFASAEKGVTPPFHDAWGGALAYTFQIYFDFSGYSDMAIGLALLFGVRLPMNFASPYKARSIVEFWRCWHITLSRFLRDYLYVPLGGNRKGPFRRYINLMLTMVLGGLWHGASWTFVAWGALHGVYLMVNHAWAARPGSGTGRDRNVMVRGFNWLLTFLAVVVAWVFFRAETFSGALRMLEGMVSMPAAPGGGIGDPWTAALLVVLLLVSVLCPNSQQIMARCKPVLEQASDEPARLMWWQWRQSTAWALLTGIAASAAVFMLDRVHEFIYFRF